MKTVCKKLFCLMLVAMMLVSAVPFAFATENTTFWIQLWVDGESEPSVNAPSDDFPADKVEDEAFIKNFAASKYPAYFDGYKVVGFSQNDTLGAAIYLETIPCEHTNKKTTNTATCTAAGTETVVCNDCGVTVSTKDVAALGHDFDGATCDECGATRDVYKAITFYYLDSNGNETSTVRYTYASGEEVVPPSVPVNPKSGFSYWKQYKNDTGMKLNKDEVLVVNSETPTEFHAIYNNKSGMSELKIYVVRYVNGVRKEANYLFSTYFTTGNTNNMYEYLWDNDDAIVTAAVSEIGEGYTWNNKFYNYFTDEELTNANLKDNGNKSVYIKMNTKNSNEAQVLLYVHKGKTSTVHDILEMDGYNAGETVYLNNVKDFLKDEGYKWSSISSLYTDEEYDDLMDGESPSGSNHISINNNGTHVIHVILNGASQSSNADSSNPKTGDSIMVAVTTMTLAAAALVAVVELKKRKMI